MAHRNIGLAYLLVVSKNSWFWLGIWVFYYLRFTNYSGIGLIETVLIVTTTLCEIPTGAIADLLGKRWTLVLAFLFEALGAFIMAFAPSFFFLAFSVFVMCVGGALYSGTLEALVFDSLKQEKKESAYDTVISHINSLQLATPAICSIVGGFLYLVDVRLPFILNGIFYVVGILLAYLLVEPVVDTEKFSFSAFLVQTRQGLAQLFKTASIRDQTILLLSIGTIAVIITEMLDSFLGVEFGYSGSAIGVLWAVIYIASAIVVQVTPFIRKRFSDRWALVFTGMVMGLTLLVSPVAGIITGGVSLLVRSSFMSLYTNFTSIAINNATESRYRATTLSTFNMIKNIPYVACAYFIGSLSDVFSAKLTAFYLGLLLLLLLGLQGITQRKKLI